MVGRLEFEAISLPKNISSFLLVQRNYLSILKSKFKNCHAGCKSIKFHNKIDLLLIKFIIPYFSINFKHHNKTKTDSFYIF